MTPRDAATADMLPRKSFASQQGGKIMAQRILIITGELFPSIFTAGPKSYTVVGDPLPEDTRIISVWLKERGGDRQPDLVLQLESAEWGPAAAGHELAEICPRITRPSSGTPS